MTKESFQKTIDLVIANWNLQVAGARRVEMERAWWRYLRDLPDDAVQYAIDKLVVRDGPPPRAGAVRRLAMENNPLVSLPPEPAEAWAQARSHMQNLEVGVAAPADHLHPLIVNTIRTGIREYRPFIELYTNLLQEWRDQTFGVK